MWRFVVLMTFGAILQLSDGLQWSKSYNFKALLTMPAANISEPYQVWLDGDSGSSRVDFYDGLDKLFRRYDSIKKNYVYFKIHPQSSGKSSIRNVCTQLKAAKTKIYAVNTYLPNKNFTFINIEYVNNVKAHKYVYEYRVNVQPQLQAKVAFTVWVTFKAGDESGTSVAVPVRYDYELKTPTKNLDYIRHDYLYFDESRPKSSDLHIPEDLKCTILTDSFDHEPIDPLEEFVEPFEEHSRVKQAFDRFTATHNKKYTSENEHFKRMSIFKDNLRFINSLNRQHKSFKVAVNHLADLSLEEISVFSGTKINHKDLDVLEGSGNDNDDDGKEYDDTNEALDWRDYDAVTGAKDQTLLCGSCYAFTTAASVESSAFIARGCKNMQEVSEQALVDCTWGNKVDDEGNWGCAGGTYEYTLDWIQKHGAPLKEEYGSYLAMEGRCHYKNMSKLVRISGYNAINKRIIKKALRKTGPLLASIYSELLSFTFYSSGIYDDPNCKTDVRDRTHGVNIIGYGVEEGTKYWILKNSFGTNWGEKGFMRIAMQKNVCGVKNAVYNVEFKKSKIDECFV